MDEINRRDHRDRTREDSPLTRDDTYTLVDTSDLTIDEVVEEMSQAIANSHRFLIRPVRSSLYSCDIAECRTGPAGEYGYDSPTCEPVVRDALPPLHSLRGLCRAAFLISGNPFANRTGGSGPSGPNTHRS